MEVCLTPEQAAKEDIAAEMSKSSQAGDCTFAKRDFAGGKLDVAGKCKTPQGEMDITMTGTVEPKKTDIVMNMKGNAPTGNGGHGNVDADGQQQCWSVQAQLSKL